ncbi:uncharacterized protein LOC135392289 [Ornithodoros turicata]|uniref:uncharacterized protein LOC135392289 n=1 Tax=Ornithodoros turicata TaxID=34597 RepID=UPI003138E431
MSPSPARANHSVCTTAPSVLKLAIANRRVPGRETFLGSAKGGERLFFVADLAARRCFLVDSSAEISILPASKANKCNFPIYHLTAVNNTSIPVYGDQSVTLNLGLRHSFPWIFKIAAVDQAIIGADFLQHFGVLYDPPDWTKPVRHDVVHYINASGPLVHFKLRRLAREKWNIARSEFDHMLAIGITRPSSSNWASSLHMVPKKTGNWRPCGDYRALNTATKPDRYKLPNIQDFTMNLAGTKYFSKIDLTKAYHQIPVAPEDVPKTAIVTPFGLFEFL